MALQDDAARERNALLDEVASAVDQWFDKESALIKAEASFVRAVVRGQSGSSKLAAANASRARVLVINDITSFLAGV
jgi:hypothetical protein